jgi:hypothetical protein
LKAKGRPDSGDAVFEMADVFSGANSINTPILSSHSLKYYRSPRVGS